MSQRGFCTAIPYLHNADLWGVERSRAGCHLVAIANIEPSSLSSPNYLPVPAWIHKTWRVEPRSFYLVHLLQLVARGGPSKNIRVSMRRLGGESNPAWLFFSVSERCVAQGWGSSQALLGEPSLQPWVATP